MCGALNSQAVLGWSLCQMTFTQRVDQPWDNTIIVFTPPADFLTLSTQNVHRSKSAVTLWSWLLNVDGVFSQMVLKHLVFRRCCCSNSLQHNPPKWERGAANGFQPFPPSLFFFFFTKHAAEEDWKVNLFEFEVRVVPYWLSPLITSIHSLSHTHTHGCFELWIKLCGVCLYFPLTLFDLC